MIYIAKQEEFYQNKVNSSLVKWAIFFVTSWTLLYLKDARNIPTIQWYIA